MYFIPYHSEEIHTLNTLNQKVKRILVMSRFAPTEEELEKEHSESIAAATGQDIPEKPEPKKRKAACMSLDSTFNFGKHIGLTVQEVIENHKSYIDWAVDKEVIELNEEAFEYYSSGVKEVR